MSTRSHARLPAQFTLTLLTLLSCLVALAFVPPPQATQPGKTKGFLWKVTSPTTELYFLGSIHAASADAYPLPPEIEAAFKQCSTLVVELDITQINQLQMSMQLLQNGRYPPGDSLDKHVSPETMKAFRKLCEDNGLPPEAFNQMKPGLAITAVVGVVLDKLGMSGEFGVDKHFLDAAHKDDATPAKKRIIELETADEQIKLLLDIDDKLAEASMKDDLTRTTKDEIAKLFKAWKEGDVKTVESMVIEEPKDDASKKLLEMFIYDRNDKMTKTFADLLKGKDKAFVVVGAAHLLGDRGILKQLEKQGFKVEQVDLTPVKSAATKP